MNKLPQEFRLAITREMGDDDWQLDQLLDIFKRELEAGERVGRVYGEQRTTFSTKTETKLHMPCLTVVMLTVPPALSVGGSTHQGIAKQYLMYYP